MREFFCDLRNGDFKILVKEDGKIIYASFTENILAHPDKIREIFNDVKRATGYYPNVVNLVLPDEEFLVKEMLFPKISEEETKQLIIKRLESELNTKEFNFYHYFLREEENGKVFLIQVLKGERIEYYIKFFKGFGIKVERVTSGLVLNMRIAEELTQKDDKLKIIVDIEKNAIDIFGIFNNSILKYQHFNLPKIDINESNDIEVTRDRLLKKQIYLITDYIYNFNLSLAQEFVDVLCDSFLVYGLGFKIYEGLENALKEALSQNVELLAEKLKKEKDYSAYVLLHYFSELKREKVFNFLIKKSYKEIFSKYISVKTVVMLFVIGFLSEVFLLEYINVSYKKKIVSKKNELEIEIKNLKNLEQEKDMEQKIKLSRVNLYYVFMELANKLSDDIYIEKIVYTRDEAQKRNILEVTYKMFMGKDFSRNKSLSHLRDIFKNIAWIKVVGEPSISTKTEDKKDFFVIKINYELGNNVK